MGAQVILNIAASGQFSSDRTTAEYAREIWQVAPVPVDYPHELRSARRLARELDII